MKESGERCQGSKDSGHDTGVCLDQDDPSAMGSATQAGSTITTRSVEEPQALICSQEACPSQEVTDDGTSSASGMMGQTAAASSGRKPRQGWSDKECREAVSCTGRERYRQDAGQCMGRTAGQANICTNGHCGGTAARAVLQCPPRVTVRPE